GCIGNNGLALGKIARRFDTVRSSGFAVVSATRAGTRKFGRPPQAENRIRVRDRYSTSSKNRRTIPGLRTPDRSVRREIPYRSRVFLPLRGLMRDSHE